MSLQELDGLLKLCDSMRSKMTDMEREITKWEATDEVNVEDLSKKIEDTKVAHPYLYSF